MNCPSDKPTFDGIKCTECPNNTYYDQSILECVFCTNGRNYNKEKD